MGGGFLKERAYSTGAEAFSVKSYAHHPRSGATKEFHLKQYAEVICCICMRSHIKNCLNRNRIMKENLQSSRLLAQVACKWASPYCVLVEEYRILSSVSLQKVEQGKDFKNRPVQQKAQKLVVAVVSGHLREKKKPHFIFLQYYQSPLMRIVLSAVQSCSGDVQHQSSHIHSPAIESVFIKDVCNCTVIITDKRRFKN